MDIKEVMKKLQEPFKPDEIEWRVQSQGKSETGGKIWCQVLAYVDARALQNRLDEVFTPFGWEDKYEPLGDDFICTLTVDFDGKKVSFDSILRQAVLMTLGDEALVHLM